MKKQTQSKTNTELVFAPEDEGILDKLNSGPSWKILIVDDEPGVHEVTRMSLNNFEFCGREFEFYSA